MDRDCNKCVWHTDGNCKKWDCEYKTVEDIRAEIEEEAESRMQRILDDEKKLSYEQGKADGIKELLMPYDVESIEELIENVRNKADKEHKEMCNSCIHKVSKEDIDAIRADAIDEFENKILGNCSVMLKDGERVIVIRQDIFKFVRDELKENKHRN